MVLTDKKELLKEIIENADEKLMSLMIALANEYNDTEQEYSQDEIQQFRKIRDEMLAHPENTYTPEQAHELIRNKKKMRFQIKVSQTAYNKTEDVYEHYEEDGVGLGETFLKCIEDAYSKLSQTPQFYSCIQHDKNIRDIKIEIFPFVIIYQIVENTVLILGVFNH